jgi:uncharacterized protein (DUF2141 family)
MKFYEAMKFCEAMKYLLTLFIIISLNILGFSQNATITLKVDNIEKAKGAICISIFDTEDDYKNGENQVWTKCISVTSTEFIYEIEDLPLGTYAISVYHDENSNDEFDTKWYGLPKERYGFSNNVKGKFGPPKFEDARFELKEDMVSSITLVKM